jgi:hypothetical protein
MKFDKSEYDAVMLAKSSLFSDMIMQAITELQKRDLLGFKLSYSSCDSVEGSYIFTFRISWLDEKHIACCGGGGYSCFLFASPLGVYVNQCLYSQGSIGLTTLESLVAVVYDRLVLCDFRSHDTSD